MEINPNLSEKAQHDYRLVLSAINGNQKNINRNPKKNQNSSKKEKSLANKFTGFFKSNKKNNKTNSVKKEKSFANKLHHERNRHLN